MSLPKLTRREREVARLLAQGLSNKEIANALVIETHTAKIYVSAVLRKLGVDNRTKAALLLSRYIEGL